MRGAKTDDSYEDGGFEASNTTTVTRMATRMGSIPVTVGTFEAWGAGEPRTENISVPQEPGTGGWAVNMAKPDRSP